MLLQRSQCFRKTKKKQAARSKVSEVRPAFLVLPYADFGYHLYTSCQAARINVQSKRKKIP